MLDHQVLLALIQQSLAQLVLQVRKDPEARRALPAQTDLMAHQALKEPEALKALPALHLYRLMQVTHQYLALMD